MKEREDLKDMTEEEREALKKAVLEGPQLQGLVMAPQTAYGPPQMLYGPPPDNNIGFMGMYFPHWTDDETWKCSCGKENKGKFCTECAAKAPPKPAKWLDDEKWRCACGNENSGKFCPECGAAAPPRPAKWLDGERWLCFCGTENKGRFCSECGAIAPEKISDEWKCPGCGTEHNKGKFCAECGTPRP